MPTTTKYITQIQTPDGSVYNLKDEAAWEQLNIKLEKQIVNELPDIPTLIQDPEALNEALRTIYFVPAQDPVTGEYIDNEYDEYVLIYHGEDSQHNPVYSWEQIGTTQSDIKNFSVKGHTHDVTTQVDVANHVFTPSGSIDASFSGIEGRISVSGTINSAYVDILTSKTNQEGYTLYTPDGSITGTTIDGGTHVHSIKKDSSYLERTEVRGVTGTFTENRNIAQFNSDPRNSQIGGVLKRKPNTEQDGREPYVSPSTIVTPVFGDASVFVTQTAISVPDGSLMNFVNGHEADAVFNSASVNSDHVLSFGLKLINPSKKSVLSDVSATTNAVKQTGSNSYSVYTTDALQDVSVNDWDLSTNSKTISVPNIDGSPTIVATGQLTPKNTFTSGNVSSNNASIVTGIYDGSSNNGHDRISTGLSEGSHSHTIEDYSLDFHGKNIWLRGKIENSGDISAQGTYTPEGTITNGKFTGDELTLAHNVFNPTVQTGPDTEPSPNALYDVYGVVIDTKGSTSCTRIGNMTYHKSLPIQSRMRRCILDISGNVAYYLDQNDSTKKADGTVAELSGLDGDVMVEVPKHWRKVTSDGTQINALISPYQQDGDGWQCIEKYYVSAYEAAVDKTDQVLVSVRNGRARYRGGDDSSSYDLNTPSTGWNNNLYKPRTNLDIDTFRLYARRKSMFSEVPEQKWNILTLDVWEDLCWLFVIEFATINTQAIDNQGRTFTKDGFRLPCLGKGITTVNQTDWSILRNHNPLVSCGTTNSLGNNSGTCAVNIMNQDFYCPSYRGIENIFGHLYSMVDGIFSDNKGKVSCTSDPSIFEYYDMYSELGLTFNDGDGGYIQELTIDSSNCILATKRLYGTSTSFFCDYFIYKSNPDYDRCIFLVGGNSCLDDMCGLFYQEFSGRLSSNDVGTRLCYFPEGYVKKP